MSTKLDTGLSKLEVGDHVRVYCDGDHCLIKDVVVAVTASQIQIGKVRYRISDGTLVNGPTSPTTIRPWSDLDDRLSESADRYTLLDGLMRKLKAKKYSDFTDADICHLNAIV